MREWGCNVDPRWWQDLPQLARDVAAIGAHWVRTVLQPDDDLTPWLYACHTAGLQVLGVIARESLSDWQQGWETPAYEAWANDYAAWYGDKLDALQVGNESDQVGDSSWTMDPEALNSMLRAFRESWPDILLVGPGMASGQPYAFDTSLVDAQAIHPYLIPEDLRAVGLHRPTSGQPLFVTEYPASEGMSAAMAEQSAWDVAFAFCISDLMVAPYGLWAEDGTPKPTCAEFIAAASALPPTEDTDLATNPYQAEFDAARKEIGKAVLDSTPQSPYYDGPGLPEVVWSQLTDGAVLVRYKDVPGVYALSDFRAVEALPKS